MEDGNKNKNNDLESEVIDEEKSEYVKKKDFDELSQKVDKIEQQISKINEKLGIYEYKDTSEYASVYASEDIKSEIEKQIPGFDIDKYKSEKNPREFLRERICELKYYKDNKHNKSQDYSRAISFLAFIISIVSLLYTGGNLIFGIWIIMVVMLFLISLKIKNNHDDEESNKPMLGRFTLNDIKEILATLTAIIVSNIVYQFLKSSSKDFKESLKMPINSLGVLWAEIVILIVIIIILIIIRCIKPKEIKKNKVIYSKLTTPQIEYLITYYEYAYAELDKEQNASLEKSTDDNTINKNK